VSRCLLEICVETAGAAVAAEAGGADRLELCADLAQGGTTPDRALLDATRAATRLPLVVLIRPRAGDFLYSPAEIERMAWQIELAREAGAQGVALGLLRRDGQLEGEGLARLLERARKGTAGRLQVCFHRAFDRVREPGAALEELVALGIDRVLTSGGAPRAADGVAALCRLVDQAAGRAAIMPGGVVRAHDARRIAQQTGCREIHSSAGMARCGEAADVKALREALGGS